MSTNERETDPYLYDTEIICEPHHIIHFTSRCQQYISLQMVMYVGGIIGGSLGGKKAVQRRALGGNKKAAPMSTNERETDPYLYDTEISSWNNQTTKANGQRGQVK
ncbi:hypothetical protein BGZ79_002292 [Entomortierella chlamydospora]|nr:hypothetical protein BGZ79_002292 [Entomortierella chlamydospora]